MATLYQRGEQFYINYSVNGCRIRKAVGGSRREAEICLAELRYKLSRGDILPKRPEIPLDVFFDRYLANCSARLSEGTSIRYRNAIKHFRLFFTKKHSIEFISQLRKNGMQEYVIYRQNCRPKPKAKTINMELTVLRAALNWAVENDWIKKSPAFRLKLLKTNDSRRGKALTPEEVSSLLRGCETLRDGQSFRDILITYLNTGMRRGELVNLTWDDIDWDEGVIKIQEKPFWSPKTYERDIPINHTVKDVLTGLQMRRRGIHVFTWNGKKIEDNKLRKKLITLSKRVGLPHITRIHDLRHTFASNLLMKGVDIPTVQALLGHRSWNTTLIYSHQTKEHTRKAIQILE